MTNTYGQRAKIIDVVVALKASLSRAYELAHMLDNAADKVDEKKDALWWGAFWSEFAYDIDPVASKLAEEINDIRSKIEDVSDHIMTAKENHVAKESV